MRPYPELANTGVCLAELGQIYAVYAPKGETVRLDLTKTKANFKFRWFNTRTGKWVGGGTVSFQSHNGAIATFLYSAFKVHKTA